jgi:hypothetical protein
MPFGVTRRMRLLFPVEDVEVTGAIHYRVGGQVHGSASRGPAVAGKNAYPVRSDDVVSRRDTVWKAPVGAGERGDDIIAGDLRQQGGHEKDNNQQRKEERRLIRFSRKIRLV